jgi:hypothetical protein
MSTYFSRLCLVGIALMFAISCSTTGGHQFPSSTSSTSSQKEEVTFTEHRESNPITHLTKKKTTRNTSIVPLGDGSTKQTKDISLLGIYDGQLQCSDGTKYVVIDISSYDGNIYSGTAKIGKIEDIPITIRAKLAHKMRRKSKTQGEYINVIFP